MAGNPYLWSTTAATNATADPDINFAEGQAPGSVNDSDRALMAGVAGWLKDTNSTLTTGGSANAQTVTSNVAYAALATGLRLHLKAGFTNTAACTLNLTPAGGAAFGAKAIKIIGGSAEVDPAANQIRLNGHYVFEYDAAANAAAGAWILLNPVSVGTVLQRVYFTTTTESQTTAAIFQPSALTANITPSSTSNLVRVSAIGGLKSDGSSAAAIARLHRSAGAVAFGNTALVYPQDIYVAGLELFGIDSPATTSSVTYDVRFCATTGGTNVRFLPSAVGVQTGVIQLEEIQG